MEGLRCGLERRCWGLWLAGCGASTGTYNCLCDAEDSDPQATPSAMSFGQVALGQNRLLALNLQDEGSLMMIVTSATARHVLAALPPRLPESIRHLRGIGFTQVVARVA